MQVLNKWNIAEKANSVLCANNHVYIASNQCLQVYDDEGHMCCNVNKKISNMVEYGSCIYATSDDKIFEITEDFQFNKYYKHLHHDIGCMIIWNDMFVITEYYVGQHNGYPCWIDSEFVTLYDETGKFIRRFGITEKSDPHLFLLGINDKLFISCNNDFMVFTEQGECLKCTPDPYNDEDNCHGGPMTYWKEQIYLTPILGPIRVYNDNGDLIKFIKNRQFHIPSIIIWNNMLIINSILKSNTHQTNRINEIVNNKCIKRLDIIEARSDKYIHDVRLGSSDQYIYLVCGITVYKIGIFNIKYFGTFSQASQRNIINFWILAKKIQEKNIILPKDVKCLISSYLIET